MMSFWRRHSDFCAIALLCIISLTPRLVLLISTDFRVDADEAIVGLMAKHISEGHKWPIFYYGQPYMGSLEAILAAALFYASGVSAVALKSVPLCFAVFQVVLSYFLALQFVPRIFAFVGALSVALGPSALVEWSVKPRGGFIELVCLGSLALHLTVSIARKIKSEGLTSNRDSRIYLLSSALGFVLGVAWWVNNQAVFYITSASLYLSVVFLGSLRVRALKVRRLFFVGLFGGLSFFLGSFPFWVFNLTHTPRLATFKMLRGHASLKEALAHFQGVFQESLPILLGARRFWNDHDIFWGLSIGALGYASVLIGCCMMLSLRRASRRRSATSEIKGNENMETGISLHLLFVAVTILVFSMSSFGWLTKAPRYLLPLYSSYPVLIACSCFFLWEFRALSAMFFSVALGIVPIAFFVLSNYWGGLAIPGEPFVYQSDRVAKNQSELYRWLEERDYKHIRANYWIGYRVAFETKEEVTFSVFKEPRSVRIPWYEKEGMEVIDWAPYVLSPLQFRDFSRGLTQIGYAFDKHKVGDYMVIDHVYRRYPLGKKIDVLPNFLSATNRSEWLSKLVDGDLGSRWGSGAPQAPGMEVSISFPEPTDVGAVRIDFGFWIQDAPRSLSILVESADGSICELFSSAGNYALDSSSEKWEISFPRIKARGLILRQMGSDAVFDWSMAELSLFDGSLGMSGD